MLYPPFSSETALGLCHCFQPRHCMAAFGLFPALPSALNSHPACTCLLDPSTWRPAHVSDSALPSSPQIRSVSCLGFPGFVNGSCVSRYKPAIIFLPASPPPDLPSSVSIFYLQLLCSHGHCHITRVQTLVTIFKPASFPYSPILKATATRLSFLQPDHLSEKPPLKRKRHCLAHILTYSPSRLDPHASFQPPLPLYSLLPLPPPLNPTQWASSASIISQKYLLLLVSIRAFPDYIFL